MCIKWSSLLAFGLWTIGNISIWKLDANGLSEFRTSPVFRRLLYWTFRRCSKCFYLKMKTSINFILFILDFEIQTLPKLFKKNIFLGILKLLIISWKTTLLNIIVKLFISLFNLKIYQSFSFFNFLISLRRFLHTTI